eukprot:PLAT8809.1.p1 GENE.PLAT8809.1~~PLAT8809.1.p1  ORF type:complete len:459 (+),score=171.20 PLAT8809.1:56-1378(+)
MAGKKLGSSAAAAEAPKSFINRTFLPLFLMTTTPFFVLILWHCLSAYAGDPLAYLASGSIQSLAFIPGPSALAWKMLALYGVFEAVLMVVLPGRMHTAPLTPQGNVIKYKDNGFLAYIVTHVVAYVLVFRMNLFSAGIVYDNFGELLCALNLWGLGFCVLLYFKGLFFPSSTDSGSSGNLIFDYYWGTELHPRIFGFDLKQWSNCRVAMMGWSLIILSFAFKQAELNGGTMTNAMLVCVGLQEVYIAKFFWWESGYLGSIDIMHDRFGYYICWGVYCWLPSIYTSQTLFLVNQFHTLSQQTAWAIFAVGVFFIYANWAADDQRQRVRESDGHTTVWFRKPKLIRAKYRAGNGEERNSLLLVSGFWGLSRHFHYIAEISACVAWTAPCLFSSPVAWLYPVYLTILLTHRALRDEARCTLKYGDYWKQYKEQVPALIVPFIF